MLLMTSPRALHPLFVDIVAELNDDADVLLRKRAQTLRAACLLTSRHVNLLDYYPNANGERVGRVDRPGPAAG